MARRGGRQGQMSLIILLLEILDETGDSLLNIIPMI